MMSWNNINLSLKKRMTSFTKQMISSRTNFFCKRLEEVKKSGHHLLVNELHNKYGAKAICRFLKISETKLIHRHHQTSRYTKGGYRNSEQRESDKKKLRCRKAVRKADDWYYRGSMCRWETLCIADSRLLQRRDISSLSAE